jgi:hypothetical protein
MIFRWELIFCENGIIFLRNGVKFLSEIGVNSFGMGVIFSLYNLSQSIITIQIYNIYFNFKRAKIFNHSPGVQPSG